MARRLVKEGGGDLEKRLAYAWRLAAARRIRTEERDILKALYHRRLDHYLAHPKEAEKMATDPLGPLPKGMEPAKLAALTNVCNVILNLDEVLMKR